MSDDSRDLDWTGADVLICDPPYDATLYKRATSQSKKGGARHRDLGHDPIDNSLMKWTCELAAKIPKWSCIFSDVESVGKWRDGLNAAGATYIRAIPWIRWSMPQLSGDRPPQATEMIVVAWGSQKGKKSWNGLGNLTHFSNKCLRGEGKHKCEKPLDLMLELVEYFSDPEDTIIDPFAGSGTTLLAAKLLGRPFIWNELDDTWFWKVCDRVAANAVLSERDQVRYNSYLNVLEARNEERARIKANTDRIRAKLKNEK